MADEKGKKINPKDIVVGSQPETAPGPAAEGGERSPPAEGKRKRDRSAPRTPLEVETAMIRRIARLMDTLPAPSRERVAAYVYDHYSPKFVPSMPTMIPTE